MKFIFALPTAGRLPLHACVLVLWLVALPASAEVPVKPVFTMAFGFSPAENSQYGFLSALYTELFDRLGMTFAYEILPLRRCSIEANNGGFDGEPLRVKTYAESYPEMIVVDEPVFENHVAAYAMKPLPVCDWDSLTGTTFAIDYLSGSVQTEKRLQKVADTNRINAVQEVEHALTRLQLGRCDLFIDLECRVDDAFVTGKYDDSGIIQICIIDTHDGFPVLHKKHAALAPKLAETLRGMKRDGTYYAIMRNTLPKHYAKYYESRTQD